MKKAAAMLGAYCKFAHHEYPPALGYSEAASMSVTAILFTCSDAVVSCIRSSHRSFIVYRFTL